MSRMSDLDIDRQESEGVWTAVACGFVIGPIAGWVSVLRYLV